MESIPEGGILAQIRGGGDFDPASSDVADIVDSIRGLTRSEKRMGYGVGIRWWEQEDWRERGLGLVCKKRLFLKNNKKVIKKNSWKKTYILIHRQFSAFSLKIINRENN